MFGRYQPLRIGDTKLKVIDSSGQAIIEAILIIPLLIIIIQGCFWLGELGRAKIIINIATREGARWASVGKDGRKVARDICLHNLVCSEDDLQIKVVRLPLGVKVSVVYSSVPPAPFNGKCPRIQVKAETVMPLNEFMIEI